MRKIVSTSLLAVAALLLAACAGKSPEPESDASGEVTNPTKRVTLITPIPFAESAEVRQGIRDECRLQEKLAGFIQQFSAEENIKVETSSGPAASVAGQVLEVRITGVYAPGGGAFSGGKSVTVKGELTENGQALGDFKARRISSGGAFAIFKGTCDIVGRDVETLGSDIAGFLADPSDGARMGNI